MSNSSREVYSLRRVGVVFTAAAFGLAGAVVWWMAVDYDRPWRTWQRRQVEALEALAWSDTVVADSPAFRVEVDRARKAAAVTDDSAGEAARARRRVAALRRFEADAYRRARRLEEWLSASHRWSFLSWLWPFGRWGSPAVRQVEPPHVWRDLSFTHANRTDRCMTCHTAIADPRFTKRNLARRFERTLVQINRRLEAEGERLLDLPRLPGREDVPPGRLSERWADLSEQERDALFEGLVAVLNRYQAMRGRPALHLATPLLAHPQLDLFVGERSPHPMDRMGCTICHEGNGNETDFILAGHTPESAKQRQVWEHAYTERVAGIVPVATFTSARKRWDRPMWPLRYVEASCAACHEQVTDLAGVGPQTVPSRLDRGRFLYTSLGCANCHAVEGMENVAKVGPDLTHVADKLSRGFLQRWILEPRRYRPATRMPDFFGQENNDAHAAREGLDPNPELRAKAEAVAMAAYLEWAGAPAGSDPVPAKLWEKLRDANGTEAHAAAERGRRLVGEVGCLGCHAILAYQPVDEYGELLDPIGLSWIGSDLADRMEAKRARTLGRALTDEERYAIEDAAFAQAEAMSYTRQLSYIRAHFASDETALFHPAEAQPPILTRHAPELSGLGLQFGDDRRAVQWLYGWLRDPRRYDENAVMPRMRLEGEEALDVAAYLARLPAEGQSPLTPLDENPEQRQCLAGMRDDLIARRLSRSGFTDVEVTDPVVLQARMLTTRLAERYGQAEARSRVARLSPDQRAWVFLGAQMIGHYGCFGCHSIPGFERAERIGPSHVDWGRVPVDRLDFGLLDPRFPARAAGVSLAHTLYPADRTPLIERAGGNPVLAVEPTRASFAEWKLRNPRLWDRGRSRKAYDKLRMPNFYLDAEQTEALVTWLLSRRPSEVDAPVRVDYARSPAGPIARGRRLARRYNCVGCHRIDGNVAVLDQYYWVEQGGRFVFDEEHAAPPLRGQGAKVRPEWLYAYLENVRTLRPHLKLRMPQFALSRTEREQLAAYFSALDHAEARWLAARLREHRKDEEGSDLPAWLRPTLPEATAVERLRQYAVEHRLATKAMVEAGWGDADRRRTLDAAITSDAQFLQEALAASYPFAEPAPPAPSPERLEDGRTLLLELDCLSCHVFGDPSVPGANAKPTAQNLALTAERLRYPWVLAWMQRPAALQPGTKMPADFGDGGRSGLDDFPPERRRRIKAALHDPDLLDDGPGQIRAIADFLFAASQQGVNVVAPAPPATAPAAPATARSAEGTSKKSK